MKSIKYLYREGRGPSSSHTMAPARAAALFLESAKKDSVFKVILYGSLASTGKGHLTDEIIEKILTPEKTEIVFRPDQMLSKHPNSMTFEEYSKDLEFIKSKDFFSTGGGALQGEDEGEDIYPFKNATEILTRLRTTGESYWEIVEKYEGPEIIEYLDHIWSVMKNSIENGLKKSGTLPGGLGLPRKAGSFFKKSKRLRGEFKSLALLASYAYAVAEENASGGTIVTAPTCGAAGVVPAVLYHLKTTHKFEKEDIIRALAAGGLFGNIIKHNASIAGAVVGCQGEVGTACAMAAASACQLMGGSPGQIEYAAEMGLEHHFGLTCDPVAGLVQIPCIERNAHSATRSISCCQFSLLSDGLHRISFDNAVDVMYETGKKLPGLYRETSKGGLAKIYRKNNPAGY
ncbi:MAG: L-serine ammonia-lyase, iron-sulfur-dependent, subunit alpha [Thermodesulfobacteriota bacterium]